MRFRTGLIIGAIVGYLIATRMRRSAENEEARGGIVGAMARHPSAQRFAYRGKGMANLAGDKAAQALRRARATIQRRLEANADDLSMN